MFWRLACFIAVQSAAAGNLNFAVQIAVPRSDEPAVCDIPGQLQFNAFRLGAVNNQQLAGVFWIG